MILTAMQTQEQSEVTIRSFGSGDENIFLDLIKNCFGSLEYPPRLKAEITGSYLDHKGSFGTDPWWIGAFIEKKLVGLSILRANEYGPGEGRFNGAYVLPKYREQRIGSSLMKVTTREAQRQNQRKMNVYTLGVLDYLAPGSLLYLKSGGKTEAEYLQFERT